MREEKSFTQKLWMSTFCFMFLMSLLAISLGLGYVGNQKQEQQAFIQRQTEIHSWYKSGCYVYQKACEDGHNSICSYPAPSNRPFTLNGDKYIPFKMKECN